MSSVDINAQHRVIQCCSENNVADFDDKIGAGPIVARVRKRLRCIEIRKIERSGGRSLSHRDHVICIL